MNFLGIGKQDSFKLKKDVEITEKDAAGNIYVIEFAKDTEVQEGVVLAKKITFKDNKGKPVTNPSSDTEVTLKFDKKFTKHFLKVTDVNGTTITDSGKTIDAGMTWGYAGTLGAGVAVVLALGGYLVYRYLYKKGEIEKEEETL